ncbi:MAG TPA: N-acetyltransferase, partial [Cryomorphaceae bacterium]|nr:N-acetyltransferase [Cryomorphaceae bacterium]
DNTGEKRYEMHLTGDQMAYIEYIKAQNKVYLTHTEVPKTLGGQGIGSKIVELVLKEIDQQKLELVPLCPFVVHFLKEHPKWQRLVMKGINLD